MIYRIYSPLNLYRAIVLVLDVIGFIIATMIFWNWLEFAPLTLKLFKYVCINVVIGIVVVMIISKIVNYYLNKKNNYCINDVKCSEID